MAMFTCVTAKGRKQRCSECSEFAILPGYCIVAIVTITNKLVKVKRLLHDWGVQGLRHSLTNSGNSMPSRTMKNENRKTWMPVTWGVSINCPITLIVSFGFFNVFTSKELGVAKSGTREVCWIEANCYCYPVCSFIIAHIWIRGR